MKTIWDVIYGLIRCIIQQEKVVLKWWGILSLTCVLITPSFSDLLLGNLTSPAACAGRSCEWQLNVTSHDCSTSWTDCVVIFKTGFVLGCLTSCCHHCALNSLWISALVHTPTSAMHPHDRVSSIIYAANYAYVRPCCCCHGTHGGSMALKMFTHSSKSYSF